LFAELASQGPAQGLTPYELAAMKPSADEEGFDAESFIEARDSTTFESNLKGPDICNASRLKSRTYSKHNAKLLDQNLSVQPTSEQHHAASVHME
jgi:hypothetical protein